MKDFTSPTSRGYRPPPPRFFTVETQDTLLPFLLTHIRDKSRNTVKNLLTAGCVSVNGKTTTRHDHPLSPGDRVRVGTKQPPELRRVPILYEDDSLLVISKPAGLLSVATDVERYKTAYRIMTDYVRLNNPDARLFIVHRLDRETSGVLLFAKTEAMKRALQDNWNDLVQRREYVALVEGAPERERGVIRTYLHETKTHLVYSGRSETGVLAVTHYTVLRRGEEYSLLMVDIKTGRKNQIRAHLSELGCPVAGDKKYGAETNPLGRLALHATTLELINPLTKRRMTFSSPVPKEFERAFNRQFHV